MFITFCIAVLFWRQNGVAKDPGTNELFIFKGADSPNLVLLKNPMNVLNGNQLVVT